MKIDVVLLTLNSNSRIFRLCLRRLKGAVSVNRLIVVDGGSEDGTLDAVRSTQLPMKIIVDEDGNRATARQKGIEEVETEFFMFVDDDIILERNWWNKVRDLLKNKKVGAVWGVSIPAEPKLRRYFQAMSIVHGKNSTLLELQNGVERGMTHDTVIRTEAVEGIQIPESLPVLEDEYIRRYIENRGYHWVATDMVKGYHYKDEFSAEDIFAEGMIGRIMGLYGKEWFRTRMTKGFAKLLYLLLLTQSREIMNRETKKLVNYLRGWLSC